MLLLVAMGFLLFRKGQDDKDAAQKVPEVARVSTPTLPDAVQTDPVPSQAMQPVDPIPMLPPLPPQESNAISPGMLGSRQEREIERGPSLLDRRIAGSGGGVGGMSEGAGPGWGLFILRAGHARHAAGAERQHRTRKVRRGPDVEDVSSASYIRSPDALLVRGTYLRCVLETRIITDLAGYTSCLLTEPVYSINGRSLLLPKGSRSTVPTAVDLLASVWK